MFGLGEPKCHECKQLERELDREIAKNRKLQSKNEQMVEFLKNIKCYYCKDLIEPCQECAQIEEFLNNN